MICMGQWELTRNLVLLQLTNEMCMKCVCPEQHYIYSLVGSLVTSTISKRFLFIGAALFFSISQSSCMLSGKEETLYVDDSNVFFC